MHGATTRQKPGALLAEDTWKKVNPNNIYKCSSHLKENGLVSVTKTRCLQRTVISRCYNSVEHINKRGGEGCSVGQLLYDK